ncbi:hypothetical protein MasN3_42830 [Massilia varians]|uniref:Energy transducer TonB n=2 Tax=Massilia varians TaxID=457921 RepID=A0ABN6TEY6_9BURK|nr:hypothetical protein MasN3_42830 [Massilia varians]
MASFPLFPALPPGMPMTSDRRLAGILATVLVHTALVLGWQVARTLPPPETEAESPLMQWIELPPLAPEPAPAPARPDVSPQLQRQAAGRPARSAPAVALSAPSAPAEAPTAIVEDAEEAPARPNAANILENARRSVGSIDRALRKENKPLIVAPPDSPELRMRRGMEQAHALAPPRLWEAPKVEELVNNTGDGARRTRVISGRRT